MCATPAKRIICDRSAEAAAEYRGARRPFPRRIPVPQPLVDVVHESLVAGVDGFGQVRDGRLFVISRHEPKNPLGGLHLPYPVVGTGSHGFEFVVVPDRGGRVLPYAPLAPSAAPATTAHCPSMA
ncbi:hypothetical protein ACISU4_29550 [Streptomyces wuyuanensis]|uniref:hypothetical protein n=1 Tax=Streptomyces wuyuanensis TaxID=1196353 RepID=UPI00381F74CB